MFSVLSKMGSLGLRLIESPNFRRALALGALFAIAAWLTEFLTLYTFTRLLLAAVSAGLLITFLPGATEAFLAKRMDAGRQLVLGIWVSWASDLMLGIWALTIKIWDAQWMNTSDILTLWIFGKLLGGILHITSPGSTEDFVPKLNWAIVGVAVAVTIVATVVLLTAGRHFVAGF